MRDYALQLLVILVLIGIESYFAAAEIALISARRSALKHKASEGSRGARAALTLMDDPTKLLSTIQIGITVIGFLAASVGAVSLAKPVEEWLVSLGWTWLAHLAPVLSVIAVTLVISYVTLVVGELTPKRLAMQHSEGIAIGVARQVVWLERVLAPFVWVLTVSTNAVSRLVGVNARIARQTVSEEEIRLLVAEQGSLLEEEKRMIQEIFDLGDTVVREIMVPRVDVVIAEDTDSVAQVAELLRKSGYSRAPLSHEDRDRITGTVLLKDLVAPLAAGLGHEPVGAYMREPVFVPETKSALQLLSEMRETRTQLAIVVDEYGGTAGLVTMEDIVEEIVGEIADEFDPQHRFVSALGPGRWSVDGRVAIDEAIERGWPVDESDEYETLAGWMLAELGHIPVVDERIERDGYEFRVQAMRRRRVARIRVTAPGELPGHATDHDAHPAETR
jgi:putative hemolysin